MVSVESAPVIIRDLYLSLTSILNKIELGSLEGAFASWMLSDYNLKSATLPVDFTVTNYQHIAVLAFLTEANPHDYASYNEQLKEGLIRLSGRSATLPGGQPAPFSIDVVSILGISLGARRVGDETKNIVAQWMRGFINTANELLPDWKKILLMTSLGILGEEINDREVQALRDISDVQLALDSKGLNFLGNSNLDEAYQTIVSRSIAFDPELLLVPCQITALLFLSRKLPSISFNRPTIEQLISFLNNLPSALKRWPWEDKAKTSTGTLQKWDLQNEYHVQSIIYFLLAPIFSDIEHEFYFEPTGQLNSRADIGLPSLNTIIEIKFLRPNNSFSKIIEEVAADASLYFKKDSIFTSKYSKMIVFLWDDSARSQEHAEFKKGVIQLQNIEGCVVVSRPGNMPISLRSKADKK